MKKYFSLAVVTLLLAAGGFLIWENTVAPVTLVTNTKKQLIISDTPISAPTALTRLPRVSSNLVFDPKECGGDYEYVTSFKKI